MTSERGHGRLAVFTALLLFLCLIAVAAGAVWTTGPSLKCAAPKQGPVEAGWSARTLTSGGRERCYHLYIPPGLDPAQPAPLVVSLHGFVLNPDLQGEITGWHKLADREGFIVAYAQGTSYPRRWNAGDTWSAGDVDDVQFFRDLVDDLSALAAVDRARVYVNGFSNGGGMSVRIGCDAADAVAAIGSVAGAVVDMAACNPSRSIPAMAFHGTADWIVPYDGGEIWVLPLRQAAHLARAPVDFVGAEAWVAALADLNGCDATPEMLHPQGDVRARRFIGCDQAAEATLYTIEDGGHQWPGGMTIPGAGKNTMHIDATEEMWQFFQGYRLEP